MHANMYLNNKKKSLTKTYKEEPTNVASETGIGL